MDAADAVASGALVAAAGAYGVLVHRTWAAAGPGRVIRRPQVTAVAAGLAAVAVVTTGPGHELAESSLTGHMVQHVVLIGLAAPLLGLGTPATVLRAGRLSIHRWVAARWWAVALAATGWLHVVAMVGWHLPGPFAAAEANPWLHLVEHGSFLVTGVLFWATILVVRPARHRGLAVLAVFAETMAATGLGALLALARAPWYPGHDLADQQMAGVVMWAYGGLLGIVAGVALFASWLRAAERRAPAVPVDFTVRRVS